MPSNCTNAKHLCSLSTRDKHKINLSLSSWYQNIWNHEIFPSKLEKHCCRNLRKRQRLTLMTMLLSETISIQSNMLSSARWSIRSTILSTILKVCRLPWTKSKYAAPCSGAWYDAIIHIKYKSSPVWEAFLEMGRMQWLSTARLDKSREQTLNHEQDWALR